MKRYIKIMVRYSIIICIAAVGIYCFQKYQKWRYRNPVLRSKDDYVIEWHDKNLEKAIREQTGLTDGEIRLSDLWKYRYNSKLYNRYKSSNGDISSIFIVI